MKSEKKPEELQEETKTENSLSSSEQNVKEIKKAIAPKKDKKLTEKKETSNKKIK